MANGISIRVFLVNGAPGGLLTAEIGHGTGHVVAAPRSDLAVLLQRPEVRRTGLGASIGFLQDAEFVGGGKPTPVSAHFGLHDTSRGGHQYQLLR